MSNRGRGRCRVGRRTMSDFSCRNQSIPTTCKLRWILYVTEALPCSRAWSSISQISFAIGLWLQTWWAFACHSRELRLSTGNMYQACETFNVKGDAMTMSSVCEKISPSKEHKEALNGVASNIGQDHAY